MLIQQAAVAPTFRLSHPTLTSRVTAIGGSARKSRDFVGGFQERRGHRVRR
jgi:hypothetical protein